MKLLGSKSIVGIEQLNIKYNVNNMTKLYRPIGQKTLWPKGSIYISVINQNPSKYFGGTWVQLKDRFLLGAGNIYSNGATGGEATHKLTVNELPSHRHRTAIDFGGNESLDNYTSYGYNSTSRYYNLTSSEGGDKAHNNMPPYLVVYMWKRTA